MPLVHRSLVGKSQGFSIYGTDGIFCDILLTLWRFAFEENEVFEDVDTEEFLERGRGGTSTFVTGNETVTILRGCRGRLKLAVIEDFVVESRE